jgi:hypothetical protein
MKLLGIGGAAVVAGLALLVLASGRVGAQRWSRASQAVRDALTSAAEAPLDPPDSADLPAPVQRFATTLPAAHRPIRTARVVQVGTFRMGAGDDSWKPFTATETFTAHPSGFAWEARIRMMPGVAVHVRDAWAAGSGSMKGAILGLLPVVDMAGSRELDEGALSRYLAEAVWIPTRLVGGDGLTWSPRDDSTAVARLVDGAVTVELVFTFDAEGRVTRVEGARPREVDGGFVTTRWVGRFADYREFDGYHLPAWGEVAWKIDGALRPYWRGRIESVEFGF